MSKRLRQWWTRDNYSADCIWAGDARPPSWNPTFEMWDWGAFGELGHAWVLAESHKRHSLALRHMRPVGLRKGQCVEVELPARFKRKNSVSRKRLRWWWARDKNGMDRALCGVGVSPDMEHDEMWRYNVALGIIDCANRAMLRLRPAGLRPGQCVEIEPPARFTRKVKK